MDASGEGVEEILERRQRRSARRSTRHSCGAAVGKLNPFGFIFDLKPSRSTRVKIVEPRLQFLGRQVQLFGREHRAFDIVPPFFVSRSAMLRAARSTRRRHLCAGAHHRIRR